ncbi:MAG: signal peptidase I [Candidatus Thiodiazotropha sp.]
MKRWMIQTLQANRAFLLFVICMLVFRSSIADWNTVPTGSMKPTILEGDRVWVNKMAYDLRLPFTHLSLYRFADPGRGEVVIFDSAAADKKLVKRVIGLPGDEVAMRDNQISINGRLLDYTSDPVPSGLLEPGFSERIETIGAVTHRVRVLRGGGRMSSFLPVVVPEGHYLVLGDNRDNSADSRVIGFVPRAEIVGRTDTVVMSLNYDNHYLPRPERFFQAL